MIDDDLQSKVLTTQEVFDIQRNATPGTLLSCQEFEEESLFFNIPDEIIPFCELTNNNWRTAINGLYDFFRCHQIELPNKLIKSLYQVIRDQSEVSCDIADKVLIILDFSLGLRMFNSISFSSKEVFIILQYFPKSSSINILSSMIRLQPKCAKFVVDGFSPSKDSKGFDKMISSLIRHNYLNDLLPLLNLVLIISDKFDITSNLEKIFQTLILNTKSMKIDEQILSFKAMTNMCKDRMNFVSILLNSDYISSLYLHTVENDNLLLVSFELANQIASDFAYPLVFFERAKLVFPINYAIQEKKERPLLMISKALCAILANDVDAVDYFLKKKIFENILNLHSMVSYSVWKTLMCTICMATFNASDEQILYMLQFNLILMIAESSESEESEDSELGSLIVYALSRIYSVVHDKFIKSGNKIVSSEIRTALIEIANLETEEYSPVSSFIKEIDQLFIL